MPSPSGSSSPRSSLGLLNHKDESTIILESSGHSVTNQKAWSSGAETPRRTNSTHNKLASQPLTLHFLHFSLDMGDIILAAVSLTNCCLFPFIPFRKCQQLQAPRAAPTSCPSHSALCGPSPILSLGFKQRAWQNVSHRTTLLPSYVSMLSPTIRFYLFKFCMRFRFLPPGHTPRSFRPSTFDRWRADPNSCLCDSLICGFIQPPAPSLHSSGSRFQSLSP
jgi:hypothetical protein